MPPHTVWLTVEMPRMLINHFKNSAAEFTRHRELPGGRKNSMFQNINLGPQDTALERRAHSVQLPDL